MHCPFCQHDDTRVIDIGRELDARRKAPWFWLSTQEQIALARLGKAMSADNTKLVAGKFSAGGTEEVIAAAKAFGRDFDYAALGGGGVRFVPDGKPPFYASLDVAGVPRSAPAEDASVIKVERALYGTDGKPWSPRALKEGEALIVRVSITADRDMPDALLTDLLPAGLEIENFNLGDGKQWAGVVVDGINIAERTSEAELRHEEFRDDRYVAALKLDAGINDWVRTPWACPAPVCSTVTVRAVSWKKPERNACATMCPRCGVCCWPDSLKNPQYARKWGNRPCGCQNKNSPQ